MRKNKNGIKDRVTCIKNQPGIGPIAYIFPRIWMILPRYPAYIAERESHGVDVNEISNFNLRGRIVLIVYGREAKLFAITVDYLFNYLHYIPCRARATSLLSSANYATHR